MDSAHSTPYFNGWNLLTSIRNSHLYQNGSTKRKQKTNQDIITLFIWMFDKLHKIAGRFYEISKGQIPAFKPTICYLPRKRKTVLASEKAISLRC